MASWQTFKKPPWKDYRVHKIRIKLKNFNFLIFKCAIAAGVCAGFIDVLFCRVSSIETRASIFVIDVFMGWLLGFIGFLVTSIIGFFEVSVPPHVKRHLYSTLVTVALIPVAFKAFSGEGISKSPLAAYGPFIVLIFIYLSFFYGLGFFVKAQSRVLSQKLIFAFFILILGMLATILDRKIQPGLYLYLHATAAISFLVLLAFFFGLFFQTVKHATVFFGLGIVFIPFICIFPSNNAQKLYLVEQQSFVSRYVYVLEWLRSAYGGGQSLEASSASHTSANQSIFTEGIEIAGHGVDEYGFAEDFAMPLQGALNYGVRSSRAADLVSAASGRPTVILLIDALREDRLGDTRFPYLAKLADESLVFSKMYSPASSTSLVLPAIVVGHPLPEHDERGVFEILQDQGVRSAVISTETVWRDLGCLTKKPKSKTSFAEDLMTFLLCRQKIKRGFGGRVASGYRGRSYTEGDSGSQSFRCAKRALGSLFRPSSVVANHVI